MSLNQHTLERLREVAAYPPTDIFIALMVIFTIYIGVLCVIDPDGYLIKKWKMWAAITALVGIFILHLYFGAEPRPVSLTRYNIVFFYLCFITSAAGAILAARSKLKTTENNCPSPSRLPYRK